MKKVFGIVLKIIFGIIFSLGVFVAVLTVFEHRPEPLEDVEIVNNQTTTISLDESLTLMTFNIGYAGLGKAEDFVMDGGTKGRPDSKEDVLGYFEGIKTILDDYPVDIYLLQEVDLKARRSFRINQVQVLSEHLGVSFSRQFAPNFKAVFVPFPLSLTDFIGPVESGLATFTNHEVTSSTRHQFPGAFSWPLRIANLKRAMLVSVFDIENSNKQLVVVNLHMSAYDSDGSLREQEMQYLQDFLKAQYALGNYVIIGGDFNQTFPDAVGVFEVIQDYYVAHPINYYFLPSGFSFQIDITNPTCRLLNQPYDPSDENTQYYIIDGFIVSNNIVVEKFFTDQETPGAVTLDKDFVYSDHNPVVIRLRLLP